MRFKFYQVHYSTEGGNCAGYSWHTSHSDAMKAAKEAVENDPKEYESIGEGPEISLIEIDNTKGGILEALRSFAAHPDNG